MKNIKNKIKERALSHFSRWAVDWMGVPYGLTPAPIYSIASSRKQSAKAVWVKRFGTAISSRNDLFMSRLAAVSPATCDAECDDLKTRRNDRERFNTGYNDSKMQIT